MKQKLFENVGGNQFKLITESVEEENPKAKLVREGLKKVFGSGEKSLSYKRLQGVGLGYIKSVSEAQKTAIQEARILAKEYGYMDDENSQKFVKEDGEMSDYDRGNYENDFSKLDAQDSMSSLAKRSPEETNMGSPEEKREVQIGKEILRLAARVKTGPCDGDAGYELGDGIIKLAQELIQMHGQH